VRIRPATSADIPEMHQLADESRTAAHWTSQQYEALFSVDAPKRLALVAKDDETDELVGFIVAVCLADEWEIENVVVARQMHNRGIGALLVQTLVEEATAAGCRSLILEVRESNLSACRLYEKAGFIAEGIRSLYYDNPQEDAVLYRLKLDFRDEMS